MAPKPSDPRTPAAPGAPKREQRSAAITELDTDEHGFWAKLVSYGPADSFNTRWAPGVFDDSLREHKPVLAWGHDWSDPIGRMDSYEERADGPYAHFRLDDGDYVPRAKQALYQLRSGTLTDVSVGILRKGADPTAEDGTTTITRADLDEVSLVLRGAVPGAQVMAGSVRSAPRSGGISFDEVIELAKRVRAGDLSQADALSTIDLLGGPGGVVSTGTLPDEGAEGVSAPEAVVPAEVAAALAEADALETVRSRW
jgi:HK97 family phage prohead protease